MINKEKADGEEDEGADPADMIDSEIPNQNRLPHLHVLASFKNYVVKQPEASETLVTEQREKIESAFNKFLQS
jgi:hypothetical protein